MLALSIGGIVLAEKLMAKKKLAAAGDASIELIAESSDNLETDSENSVQDSAAPVEAEAASDEIEESETEVSEAQSAPSEETPAPVKSGIELTVDEQISHTINKKYDK